MTKIIGIDFGTTNTTAAVIINGKPVIIKNDIGQETTPSVISIDHKSKEILLGEAAKRRALINPLQTIYSFKRLLGVSYEDIKQIAQYFPYKVTKGKKDEIFIKIGKRKYKPVELSALIFKNVKKNAVDFLGFEVNEAVVTVPAYYNDLQRKAIKNAAEIAGWNVRRIINEPTAAALAVKHFDLNPAVEDICVIIHLGGGTIDVSTIYIGDGVYEVLSTSGTTLIGGDEIDNKIQNYVKDELSKRHKNIDFDNLEFKSFLKWQCEKAKCELSSQKSYELIFPCIRKKKRNTCFYDTIMLTSETLHKLQKNYIDLVLNTIRGCIDDSGNEVSKCTGILVGQQSRNPNIRKSVEEYFANRTIRSIDPALIVAKGAAVYAGILMEEIKDKLLLDVTPVSLGIETDGGIMTRLIEANTTIPTKKIETFTTVIDNQPSVEIHVLQGKSSMAKDNKTIGKFHLAGIQPARRGSPQIEVAFDIDVNGILNVSAKDKATDKSISIRY